MPVTVADEYVVLDSACGQVAVSFNQRGISGLLTRFSDPEADLGDLLGRPAIRAVAPPSGLVEALRSGDGSKLKYDIADYSEFDKAVWRATLKIPSGEVRSYGWVAEEIGHPRAARAVGSALGRNPIPVLIPCHRVVLSSGAIGNYGGGSAYKEALLSVEGALLKPAAN